MHKPNQFDLMGQKRFLPLFLTQFTGAFNDNLFKNAFLVLIAFYGLSTAGLNSAVLINMAAGIFILPFFLFSTLAGQLAEKYDKALLARWIKGIEIIIMLLAGLGFIWHNAAILMCCLFLMGVHSAFFGPLKYSVLPQYLKSNEILGGNGLIEMGTFVAILLGQIAGTLIIQQQPYGEIYIIIACLGFAIIGYFCSRAMPAAPPTAPNLKIGWNVFAETAKILSHTRKNKTVFNSLLGISWFWFFGSIYLTQFPNFAKDTLHGDATVYTLLMTLFSLGVAIGSLLCEKLSDATVELGLVPFGSIGLSVFAIDLFFASQNLAPASYTAYTFLTGLSSWRIIIDILLIGVFGGFFIVPLYALIQIRTEHEFTSRAIAANNILNSLFMVVAAGMSIALLEAGLSVSQLLLLAGILNAQALADGEIVAIFPEGRITSNGKINRFMPGIEQIIKTTPVPVIPMALQGLWGSFFSRKDGAAMLKMPRGIFSKIGLIVGKPIAPESVTRLKLEQETHLLRGDWQ
ncbi:MFS transporter [Deefgea piscis]|uniref:MFS transporter n=1 Tax=Deefgea piscis TaxID=2739061 RepID=UPI001C7F0E06|nr:MFS transporter [Deefgea piscis]QZA79850.1 MFS transporter [Deefgea piscis]